MGENSVSSEANLEYFRFLQYFQDFRLEGDRRKGKGGIYPS